MSTAYIGQLCYCMDFSIFVKGQKLMDTMALSIHKNPYTKLSQETKKDPTITAFICIGY